MDIHGVLESFEYRIRYIEVNSLIDQSLSFVCRQKSLYLRSAIVELFSRLSNCHNGSQKINQSWACCPLVISIGEKSLLGHLTPGFSPFLFRLFVC